MLETYIHNFKVKYEQNAQGGMYYLKNDLDQKEAKIYFDQAKRKKAVNFEDHQDRDYTLSYNTDGTFTLVRRGY
jgi:hypothetical protein